MSNPIRVATAALSGQIFAGRPTKDGMGFKEPRYDVTSDVLKAVVDKIGIGFQTDIVSDGEVVCTIKIVGPAHPAAPSDDKLRIVGKEMTEALERYGFPVSGGAKAAIADHGSSEAVALDEAARAFLAALQAEGA